jgi:hypothetical protein
MNSNAKEAPGHKTQMGRLTLVLYGSAVGNVRMNSLHRAWHCPCFQAVIEYLEIYIPWTQEASGNSKGLLWRMGQGWQSVNGECGGNG